MEEEKQTEEEVKSSKKDNAFVEFSRKGHKKVRGWWAEFKKFISKGNVIDMAIGIVVGSGFTAIVTAITNILVSFCSWGVPGGLDGLITILPAANEAQAGYNADIGLGQSFAKGSLQDLATALAEYNYGSETNANLIESAKDTILDNYTLYGDTYAYNQAAVINWGAVIQALIAFVIIALTLFVILKTYSYLKNKRQKFIEKEMERYYQRHPGRRPPMKIEEVKKTELDLLTEIRDLLKEKSEDNKNSPAE